MIVYFSRHISRYLLVLNVLVRWLIEQTRLFSIYCRRTNRFLSTNQPDIEIGLFSIDVTNRSYICKFIASICWMICIYFTDSYSNVDRKFRDNDTVLVVVVVVMNIVDLYVWWTRAMPYCTMYRWVCHFFERKKTSMNQ
jgi:hypothetical protein